MIELVTDYWTWGFGIVYSKFDGLLSIQVLCWELLIGKGR